MKRKTAMRPQDPEFAGDSLVFRKDPKANAPPSKSDASLVTNFGKKPKPREQTKKNTEDAMGGKKVQKKIEKQQQQGRLQTKQLPDESVQDFKARLKVEAKAKMQELNRKVGGRGTEKGKEN